MTDESGTTCRVAAVQMDLAPAPVEERLERMDGLLLRPESRPANLVVFPELSLTGYDLSPANVGRAEPLDGPAIGGLAELARRHDAILVAGFTEARDGRCLNAQVVVGPDGPCGVYAKRHVSSAENAIWHRGGVARVIETDLGRIGIGICADMLFGTPWSDYGQGAADLIVSAAAWPDYRISRGVPLRRAAREFHNRYPIAFVERLSATSGVPVVFANGSGRVDTRLPIVGSRLVWRLAGHSRIAVGGATLADDGDDASEQVVAADVSVRADPESSTDVLARRTLGQRLRHAELLAGEVATAWLFRSLRMLAARGVAATSPPRR